MTVNFEDLKLLPQMFELINKLNSNLENSYTKRWLSVRELAEYLSYSNDRIYKLKDEYLIESIHIKRAIKMGEISTPKTSNSIRTIDILDNLLPYLEEQYKLTGKNKSYVFLNKNDEHYYDIKRIRDSKWKNLLKECKIEYRTIYQMRHTFATIMIENSEDILWVSNMLGLADASMTLQMYAKYRKRDDVKRASFLGAI